MSHRGQTPPHQRAEYLKNEGNTLHKQGKFQAAYRKYSEAIKEDPQNAIYYANRAACSLALKEYVERSSIVVHQINHTDIWMLLMMP
jgi:tetratricopeptide (TPR) repeat protein